MAEGWYSNVVLIQRLESGVAEGWISCHVWIWHEALAWHSLRGSETSRMEQRFCRPMGWGFGRLAVLLLDCGMEKTYTI
jgi:hypothetical protein